MINKNVIRLLCLLSIINLVGCGAKVDDLVAFTAEVRQNTQVSIETYPEFNQLEALQYSAQDLRSPFEKRRATGVDEPIVANNQNCLQPNRKRSKSTLESYGLDALRMTGVFSINGQKWALIKSNDGVLHKVRRGQYLGLFNGKVASISDTEIRIKEMLPDGAGCWKEKQAKMTMSALTGEDDNV